VRGVLVQEFMSLVRTYVDLYQQLSGCYSKRIILSFLETFEKLKA
jgi:hypothetical protein